MKHFAIAFFAVSLVVAGCQSAPAPEANGSTGGAAPTGENATPPSTDASATVAFADVKAIFDQSCVKCHGAGGKGGLDLTSYATLMKGGEHGPVIVAGDPSTSTLTLALRGAGGKKQMPMMADPLAEDQIAKVEAWVKAGAKE